MLFDKLCGIVERQLPQYRKLIDKVHLFQFDYIPHLVLPKKGDISEEDRREAEDYFILPFDTVAVEDKASCVIVSPVTKGITGIWQEWHCLEITDLKNNDGKTHRPHVGNTVRNMQHAFTEDAYTISEARVLVQRSEERDYTLVSTPLKYYFGNKDTIEDENYANHAGLRVSMVMEALATDAGNNTVTCLEELMLLNNKDRFIVERRPHKPKLNGKQLPRTHQRSSYTILTVGEIRETFDKDPVAREAQRTLVVGHCRRKHWRILRNEKYKKMEDGSNKRILIDVQWVGPKEASVGPHKYVVRLDL